MKTKSEALETKISSLKKQLTVLGPMRPGSLSKQIRRKDGQPYGEYWHLSYTFAGKGHTIYVPTQHLGAIKEEVANFQKFRQLSDKIIELSIDLSTLNLKR